MIVTGAAGAAPAALAKAARPAAGGFAVSAEARAAAAAGVAATDSAALLALQEADPEPVQDRLARRRGERILTSLGAVQRALLENGDVRGAAAALASAAGEGARAASPGLQAALDAVVLRARVQLALLR